MLIQLLTGTGMSPRIDRTVMGVRRAGFTLIELMVGIAILAVILAAAIPNFTKQIQGGRAEMAAKSFARALASARDISSRTGHRTEFVINPASNSVTGCDSPAWVIMQDASTTPLVCMTKKDFVSRYEGTSMSPDTSMTITYLPTGIANNTSSQTFAFVAGNVTKKVTINAGGTADIAL